MVSLDDIREYVASLFIMLNKKTVILFRIEFLVVLVTLVFFAMFVMDLYRRVIHNSFMRALFSVFDAVSDSIVVYLLGAMQTAPFKNQLFPVWALVLVNFRYSADYISGYGVPDRRGRRFTEWRNVFKLLGSAFLNRTRGSSFVGPLWLVWGLQIVRSGYRFSSHSLASRSVWHGGSSELVAEHMHAMHERGDQVSSSSSSRRGELFNFNPETMEGYRYLVYGETKQKKGGFFKLKKPQYALSTDDQDQDEQDDATNNTSSCSTRNRRPKKKQNNTAKKKTTAPPLITLDKIWKYCRPIQQQQQGNEVVGTNNKDLPLAFALSRLLRCRFEDVTLQRCIFDTNRDLVKSMVAGKVGASDALRIMELQLAFVHDYFNTRYPMVFWCGLPSLFISLLLSVLTMGAVVWLAVDIRKVLKPPSGDGDGDGDGELATLVKGFNVDTIITWVFIVLMVAKEIWEMRTYLCSDWTSLIMACEHVQRKSETQRTKQTVTADDKTTVKDCVLLYFSRPSKISRWHGCLDQYVFVESYDDRPRLWNLIHNLTTGIVPKKDDGAKLGTAVQVPDCVREAVLKKLSELTQQESGDGHGRAASSTLPRFIKALSETTLSTELQRYQAYTATTGGGVVLPTASHVILVWHIATSLCEMELAATHGVDLGSPGFPCSLLSWFSCLLPSKPNLMGVVDDDKKGCSCCTNCCCSCSYKAANGQTEEEETKQQQVSNGKLPAGSNLRRAYIVANSLSRYCAYLLVSKPDLIPDSFLVPKIVFQKAVRSARDGIFKDSAGSLQERHRALKDEAENPAAITDDTTDRGEDVLKQGVALGKELLKHPAEEGRWEILADVWTELLIHIAPTWNVRAHKKCLSAGEFITHVWALLWHYGIQKSSLWPKDTGPGNSELQLQPQPQVAAAAAGNGIDTRQTGGDIHIIVGDRHHIGITIDEADDNKEKHKGTRSELEAAGDSSSTTSRMDQGTGSSEIEELSPQSQSDLIKYYK